MGGQLATIILAMVLVSGAARAANSATPATATATTATPSPYPLPSRERGEETTATTASPSSAGGFNSNSNSNSNDRTGQSPVPTNGNSSGNGKPVRIEPVKSERPVSLKSKQMFDELFGQELKAAQAGPGAGNGLTLAEKIFDEVRKGNRTPDFVGYCLDQVVSLASASADGGLLAYNALGAQKTMFLRPRGGCLEKMMVLGPRVLEELPSGRQTDWLNKTWGRDAAEYAVLLAARGDGAGAAHALEVVSVAASQVNLSLPQSLDLGRDGVEFFKGVDEVIAQARTDVAAPGDHPDAHLLLGIVNLARDRKPAEAVKHFRASGSAAGTKLAAALEMVSSGAAGDMLGLARAEAALAGEAMQPYFKLLLWQQAAEEVDRGLESIDLGKDDRQAAMQLKEETTTWLADLGGKLPPLVAAELASAAAKPPEVADEEAESRQTFFGIPFRQAKRVVYLVDCSASSSGAVALLKSELGKSVAALAGEQNFSIVFCSSSSAQVLPGGLVPATDSNKEAALKFIEGLLPRGRANPKDGLARAFALEPTVICLLTDGDPGQAAVKQVADLNRRHGTVVHTLAFGNAVGAGVLREIAAANGGAYRFVGEHRAAPPRGPMPAEDRDRLDRLVGYLEKNAGEPLPKLQKTVELAKNLMDKYGDSVPEAMRKRAEKVFARLGV